MRTIVKLPFSNAMMHTHTGKIRATAHSGHGLGTGIGSVLLRTAGGGAGSSYMDIDDYIATTGIDPYKRTNAEKKGEGLRSLSKKLSNLSIKDEPMKLRKNITM